LAAAAGGSSIGPMRQGLRANADAYGAPLMRRLDQLAAFTEVPGRLTRRYLSRAHLTASRQVAVRMQEAGMGVRTDALFSVLGRYKGRRPQAPAIMLGSHLDTVLDAGRYDGGLGVLAAIAVVAELSRGGERLQHAIEVAAFGEEEGSRLPTHILTSSALIGAVGPELMDVIAAVLQAIAACGQAPLSLPSGAGHDAGITARHCPAGMMFLRCKDGISRNPADSITAEDAEIGLRALLAATRRLDHRPAGPGTA
jgi:acetylornithine deacetylase/succinyl-diaminopimelate desuccinylase-like protein